jgi:hypothetical protein
VHTLALVDGYVWDPVKAAANLAKHKVNFADAALRTRWLSPWPILTQLAKRGSLLWPLIQWGEFW